MYLIDSHTHLDDKRFNQDRKQLIQDIHAAGVHRVLNVGADMPSSIKSVMLADEYEFIYASVGVHPHDAEGMTDENIVKLRELAAHNKVVAIGEIGLDYYYDNSPREKQGYWFRRQISLARELSLPLIIHDRDAHGDCLDIIIEENARDVGGVFHCFAGSVEMAKKLIDLNFLISFAGPVTYKNSARLREVASWVPMDKFLIETDSPYLSPEPNRGKRNDSRNVKYVAEMLAQIKNCCYEDILNATSENVVQKFGIKI